MKMKSSITSLVVVLAMVGSLQAGEKSGFAAEAAENRLLDAKMDLFLLRLRYTELHPKIQEQKATIEILEKHLPRIPPAEYLKRVQEMLIRADLENELLKVRYSVKSPERIKSEAKVEFLREERDRARIEASR